MPDTHQKFEQLRLVLDAARSLIAQEFAIAERLEAKSRAQAVNAGAVFFGAQVFGVGALTRAGVADFFVATIAGSALIALVALVAQLLASNGVWRLYKEPDMTSEALEILATEVRDESPEAASETLLQQYRWTLDQRRAANRRRTAALRASQGWWIVVIVAAGVEAALALLAYVTI